MHQEVLNSPCRWILMNVVPSLLQCCSQLLIPYKFSRRNFRTLGSNCFLNAGQFAALLFSCLCDPILKHYASDDKTLVQNLLSRHKGEVCDMCFSVHGSADKKLYIEIHFTGLGCIHIDTSTGYGYPSAGYSKQEFACIAVAAFTLIQVHTSSIFHSYGSFCTGLVSWQPVCVGM